MHNMAVLVQSVGLVCDRFMYYVAVSVAVLVEHPQPPNERKDSCQLRNTSECSPNRKASRSHGLRKIIDVRIEN